LPFPTGLILGLLTSGLILGSIYALMAVGVTLIYGILRVVNFAHGELYMIGGYALYFFVFTYNLPTILGLPVAFLSGFVVAAMIEKTLIGATYSKRIDRPAEYALLATFALSILLQNLAINVLRGDLLTPPALVSGAITFAGLSLTDERILAGLVAIGAFGALGFFLKYTWQGRIWRAVAQNRDGAVAIGISVQKVSLVSFAVSGGLAAVAGGLLAPIYSVYPTVGLTPLIMAFVIIVIGGLGSVAGSFLAGLIVGASQSIVSGLTSSLSIGDAAVFLLMILFLVFRPNGLLGEIERKA